jgi:hypothetical protein
MNPAIEKVMKFMRDTLLTNTFYKMVQRWAAYTGETLSVGDADTYLENLGVWTKEHKEFNVTRLKDMCGTQDNGHYVFAVEKVDNQPRVKALEIYIYAIVEHDEQVEEEGVGNEKYTMKPSLERLKKDFEGNAFKCYRSLIRWYNGYILQPFNKSDTLKDFAHFQKNLLYINEEYAELVKNNPVFKIPKDDDELFQNKLKMIEAFEKIDNLEK